MRKMKQIKHDIQVDTWNSSVLTSAGSDERTHEMMGCCFTVVCICGAELLLPSFDSEPDHYTSIDNTCLRSAKNDKNCCGQ